MVQFEKLDQSNIKIETMTEVHSDEIIKLWNQHYSKFTNKYKFISEDWKNDSAFRVFIKDHIKNKDSIIVRYGHEITGYMTYDMFDFHNEKTAFFPIMAHSAKEEYKISLYRIMYSTISQKLVRAGCLNHLFTHFSTDELLKKYLYESGFGLYVVDAFQDVKYHFNKRKNSDFQIRKAQIQDSNDIHELLMEFNEYYRSAPLFLKRDVETHEEVESYITGENNVIFVALKEDKIVGFINVRVSEENDPITLVRTHTGLIDPLGAYIKEEYRQSGLGTQLLNNVFDWCNRKDLKNIHVDFESANQNALQFWPHYFIPVLFSVKRRINNDV
ncbi:MAG: GNAT family N-acetyltransferase [Spirochaetales bacterium]|nr:GNAT family N-acetyltransferase [Spirochaetales bacterium]